MSNRLFIPGNKEQIKAICKNGFNSFILPVENMSIGFDAYFTLEEINVLSKEHDIYLMINKFFHHAEISEVIKILDGLENIKGMFIEDLGLITNLKNQNVILYQNHLNMSYDSINMYNDLGIKNIILSNELTIEEMREIKEKSYSKFYYFILSKNILMYTRRNLVSNYNKHFGLSSNINRSEITESVSGYPMIVKEKEYGTAILDNHIFSGYAYYDELSTMMECLIYNFTDLSEEDVEMILTNIENKNLNDMLNINDYFLHNKIGYKVKDVA